MKGSPRHATQEVPRDLYTVTEISEAVRQHLESEFPRVSVIGEIANLKIHTSGHVYFTLRDNANMIHAVLFRRYAECIACDPENGMLVIAPGRISHFGGSGQTQIIATDLIPAGRGTMELEFRRLLQRLMDEGLTAQERKRPIAPYPSKIGVITSPTGAVIRDITNTIARRWPVAEVIHVPADVQGPGAARSIVSAFEIADGIEDIDTVILARGGGSVEDLWTFNLEEVARAVAASAHPVITGIGHEIDTTVADYVADVRAATPTAAAELATPLIEEIRRSIGEAVRRIESAVGMSLENNVRLVEYIVRSAAFPAIAHRMERAELELDDSIDALLAWWEEHLNGLRSGIDSEREGLADALRWRVGQSEESVESLARRLMLKSPALMICLSEERTAHLSEMLGAWRFGSVRFRRSELGGKLRALRALDPRDVLRRGYTVCTMAGETRIIPRVKGVTNGSEMAVHFHDGEALCTVTEKRRRPGPWRKR
ncbi:MAG: exodeoxyribonuclease VII large subunit [Candidatus Krumholzibacteria bacterium]|nr:exodeoxyribonuclease VII large subunit [Candidatus Krumholzibacteria bacterium]